MRVGIQVLVGVVLGVAIVAGVSGLRRPAGPMVGEATTQENKAPSTPHVEGTVPNPLMPADADTVHPPVEDSASAGSSLLEAIERLERGSPLQLATSRLVKGGDEERVVADMLRRHRLVRESPDEPAWTRDTERKLRDSILASQEGAAFEVASIVCRSAGCEVQVFSDSTRASGAWHALTKELAKEIPFTVLSGSLASASDTGRRMNILFLLKYNATEEGGGSSRPWRR